jgi:hypothetical protein
MPLLLSEPSFPSPQTGRILRVFELFQRILCRISRSFAICVDLTCGECLVFSEKTAIYDPPFCRWSFEGYALSPFHQGFQARIFWASNFNNFTFFINRAPRWLAASRCGILPHSRESGRMPHLFIARFRGFLEYFPPARASFSSGIRGVEKIAFAARSIFSGKMRLFSSNTSLHAFFRSQNIKLFDEHG